MHAFDYVRPSTVDEAVAALGNEEAVALAGGQTLLPTMKQRLAAPSAVVDLRGIADLGGIVVQVFFSLAILNSQKRKAYNAIGFLVAGYILYEIVQPYLPRGVFDWKDVYGTVIGGFVAVMFLLLLRLIVKDNRVFIKF